METMTAFDDSHAADNGFASSALPGCSGLVSIRPPKYINSRHGCASRCSRPTLCAPIYTACAVNAITLAGYRLPSATPYAELEGDAVLLAAQGEGGADADAGVAVAAVGGDGVVCGQ